MATAAGTFQVQRHRKVWRQRARALVGSCSPTSSGPERPQDGQSHSGGVTMWLAGWLRRIVVMEEIRSDAPSSSLAMAPRPAQ